MMPSCRFLPPIVLWSMSLVSSIGLTLPAGADAGEVVRFATWNVSMYRASSGELVEDLRGGGNRDARQSAEVIQRVRPDVLLLNEFDYDADGIAARIFCTGYLQVGQNGHPPIVYPYLYSAPVNTGVPTGVDLDRDGKNDGPADAFGFGRHPGQYGMMLLSKYPIPTGQVRTFRTFLWKDMPDAMLPVMKDSGASWYSPEALEVFRLSSKSHWDIPVRIGNRTVHVLAAHPTPPIFDGDEDRNGRRNHDEIRLWSDYVSPGRGDYIYDDTGRRGGLPAGADFVIVGDCNADPHDGDSTSGAIRQLLENPQIDASIIPASEGAVESARRHRERNGHHIGDPRHDTAMFSRGRGPGNLRVDYVLPGRALNVHDAGVFWPTAGHDGAELIEVSDHRLVWVDVKLAP
ncbi:MAG: endonuclease/exonuclease/phosphatase family protein [Maioricimonas sp. JB045]